jgi:NADH:ubiquinone reductase (non-electrogenic)
MPVEHLLGVIAFSECPYYATLPLMSICFQYLYTHSFKIYIHRATNYIIDNEIFSTFHYHDMASCCESQEVEDAQKIRRSVIDCFEKASLPNISEEEKRKNLHFVVIGGGPTGVEFAAELHDFLVEDLVKLYPAIQEFVKITIIQSGEHILNM